MKSKSEKRLVIDVKQPIDDYDLIDMDYEEFLRRGREAFADEDIEEEAA